MSIKRGSTCTSVQFSVVCVVLCVIAYKGHEVDHNDAALF